MQGLFLQLRCIQPANLFTGSLLDEIVVNGCILQDTEENLCEQVFNNWKKPNATDIHSTSWSSNRYCRKRFQIVGTYRLRRLKTSRSFKIGGCIHWASRISDNLLSRLRRYQCTEHWHDIYWSTSNEMMRKHMLHRRNKSKCIQIFSSFMQNASVKKQQKIANKKKGKFHWHPLRFALMADTPSHMRNDHKPPKVSVLISLTPNQQLLTKHIID